MQKSIKIVDELPITEKTHITTHDRNTFANQHGFFWLSSKNIAPQEDKMLCNSLALYKAEDDIGFGVVCINPDGLEEDTVLGEYTGENIPYDKDDNYCLNFGSTYLSSKNQGNIIRFFLSLPTSDELEQKYTMNDDEKKQTSQANCVLKIKDFGNRGIPILQTSRKVQYGEIMGFDYSQTFWMEKRLETNGKLRKKLFHKTTGKVLPHKIAQYDFFEYANDGSQISQYGSISTNDLEQHLKSKSNITLSGQQRCISCTFSLNRAKAMLKKSYQPEEHPENIYNLLCKPNR